MENRELSVCEKNKTRKYTSLKPVSVKSLKKHMNGVEKLVQDRIKSQLSGKQDGKHFIDIIAWTPEDKFLLCFTTLEDESDMRSISIIDLLDDVSDTYAIDASQFCFFVCDHASVKVAVARKARVPMIGCASHRSNLAMQATLREHSDVLDKVYLLMTNLNAIKNRHRLRELGELMPVFCNATRWSSTFSLKVLKKIDDDTLADVIPTARNNIKLKRYLKKLENANKKLQTESMSLHDVRLLFDHVIKHFPGTAACLSPTPSLVKFSDFENDVVNLLLGKQSKLSRSERVAVANLLLPTDYEPRIQTKKRSFAETALADDKPAPSIEDLKWIPPTSNDVESLFSRAGIVFSLLRHGMSITTLESVLFLLQNRSLWDASVVADAIERSMKKQRV
ncbi:LOW QUALITY PROTEIN: hypothetical protein PHMEG_00018157 [Phytophthora megakarya]|uniref:HAT C-terminal dimerisation domain-containing protein n=1 Tax=Phytophthora megakarya TaxID=4795 RepID=A0A225VV06_9STRA|nr:LOW QUALITY PROTEIN: hypothetical protein PHMEG_00018157 [Phytophthora megakarya]